MPTIANSGIVSESRTVSGKSWIFGNPRSDMLWIHLPGMLCILYLLFFNSGSLHFRVFTFTAVGLIDIGHVYTTLGRTYLDENEFHRTRIYLWAPPLIFGSLLFAGHWPLLRAGIPVVHFMISSVHSVRQYYGISKWYQMKNEKFRKGSDIFLYVLCALPILIAARFIPLSLAPSLLLVPTENPLHSALVWLFVAIFFCWAIYEILLFRKSREMNRILSVALPVAYCAFPVFSGSFLFAGIPMKVSHGAAYMGLTKLANEKTSSPYASVKGLAVIFGISFFLGGLSYFLRNHSSALPATLAFAAAMFQMAAFFCHVLFDTFLWRRSHPQAALIYA